MKVRTRKGTTTFRFDDTPAEQRAAGSFLEALRGAHAVPGAEVRHTCDDEANGGGDGECLACGERDCPRGEPLHYHHDGCPVCDGGTRPEGNEEDRS